MNPCNGKECQFGAMCTASLDGSFAWCQCNHDSCSSYAGGRSHLVCGSDGKDYDNVCEMKKASCQEMRNIELKYDGKCDPCKSFNCESNKVCHLNEDRKPVCDCDSLCPMRVSPVCGSNGKTYSNECIMKVEECKTQMNIRKLFEGECSQGRNPCRDVNCGPYSECNVRSDVDERVECICHENCELIFQPVCGNDGKNYDNECLLQKNSCLIKKEIAVNYNGLCSEDDPCIKYKCENGATCIVRNGQPFCVCSSCSEDLNPVCGVNGVSYTNECKLKAENCEKKQNIHLDYKGLCRGCENKKCDFYSICEVDSQQRDKCICPTSCVQVENSVCGTDGVTYINECELRVNSCSTQKRIVISSKGSCDKCANVKCRHGDRCENGKCVCHLNCDEVDNEPVCANDGLTYPSECVMRQRACEQSKELEVIQNGRCDDEMSGSGSDDLCNETTCRFNGSCFFDSFGFQECQCNFICPALRESVCGSDGKSYGSQCLLKEMACKLQKDIKEQGLENCEDIDEELCNGMSPLVNPKTGQVYDCSQEWDNCPSGSYCHKLTTSVARCCQEDRPISSCHDTKYGCCPDGKTISPAPHQAGCQGFCRCNTLGSLSSTCDPISRQCICKAGVGGLRCDLCQTSYWGLQKIKEEGNAGCIPCGCNPYGSLRDDCEQMTGRCVCRLGIIGQKCSQCSDGRILGPSGCTDESSGSLISCAHVRCSYGASCHLSLDGIAECICSSSCLSDAVAAAVCGSDGQTYASVCQLKFFECRLQKNISISFLGSCHSNSVTNKSNNYLPTSIKKDFGLIGDFCSSDKFCSVEKSICFEGFCLCRDGFLATDDRQRCTIVTTTEPPFNRRTRRFHNNMTTTTTTHQMMTSSKPLPFKTTLMSTTTTTTSTPTTTTTTTPTTPPTATTSTTPITTTKQVKATRLTAAVTTITTSSTTQKLPIATTSVNEIIEDWRPSFSGESFVELRRHQNGQNNLSIEMYFVPQSLNGILFYTGQSDNVKEDFISLSLQDGFIEFRYELGSGLALLKSKDRVEANKLQKVLATRYNKDGFLKLNDNAQVSGTSKGTLTGLNLGRNSIYLGLIPGHKDVIEKQVGTSVGFVGCIDFLKVSESIRNFKQYDLNNPKSPDIQSTNASGLSQCSEMNVNPCDSSPCEFSATCNNIDYMDYICICPDGKRTKTSCTKVNSTATKNSLLFDGNTHHVYYNNITETHLSQNSNKFEITFRTLAENGTLLLLRKGNSVREDYLAIVINKGRIETSYNLGKQNPRQLFFITSNKLVHDDKWHTLVFTRNRTESWLSIDDEIAVSGSSNPGANQLDTDGMILIGGRKDEPVGLPLSYYSQFIGCISQIKINDHNLHLVNDRILNHSTQHLVFCE